MNKVDRIDDNVAMTNQTWLTLFSYNLQCTVRKWFKSGMFSIKEYSHLQNNIIEMA